MARCPECGGEVGFSHAASVLSVCSYCQSVLARTDIAFEKIGKVGALVDLPSPLSLGMRGGAYGGFSVLGRLQLDHGQGTWNEWCLGLDGEKWLWLAEVMGRYYLTAPMGPWPHAPPFEKVKVGRTVHVPAGGPGTVAAQEIVMRVIEVHTARIVAAEGELPFRVVPGEKVRYADLSGPRRAFGTLDYGASGEDEVMAYVGRQVDLQELALADGSGIPVEHVPRRPGVTIKAARLSCPECDGALSLRAPDLTLRVTCPYCRALVDCQSEPLRRLATLSKLEPQVAPRFPLGTHGTLRGTGYTVIGHLRRQIEDKPFTWDEYLLLPTKNGGECHYLVESGGHYTLVRPAHFGDITGTRDVRAYEGERFELAERCTTRVVHVNGEFPWMVEVGERARVADYAREGRLLSIERSIGEHEEVVASIGDYLEPEEVAAGFSVSKDGLPRREYVAPHQTNPHRLRLDHYKPRFFLAASGMLLLALLFAIREHASRTVLSFNLSTVSGVEPAAEHIFLSEPFVLGGSGQAALEFELQAPVYNSWLGLDVALVNEDDGTAYEFGAEVAYYAGREGGESWSEGSQHASVTVPEVKAGRYVLRIEPSWPVVRPCESARDCGSPLSACAGGRCLTNCLGTSCPDALVCAHGRCVQPAMPYRVRLRHGVSRPGYALFFTFLMGIFPLITWVRLRAFEQRRKEDMEQ